MKWTFAAVAVLGVGCVSVGARAQAPAGGAATDSEQSLLELRNTAVNILQALVQRGVLSQQDAQAIVADAQKKAQDELAATRAREAAEQNAVRVTYVPDVVKEEIATSVRKDVEGAVVDDVVERAKKEGWGVPGALPAWVRNMDIDTRLRVRGEGEYFDEQNATDAYLNLQAVNDAGGIGAAGQKALMNTTEDRGRMRARLRIDLTSKLTDRLTAKISLATGNTNDPISMNQTLGTYERRWGFAVQNASIEWALRNARETRGFDILAGRFDNPFLSTQLIWDEDLSFEGLASKMSFDVFHRKTPGLQPGVSFLVGAFPLEEVELSQADKWMYAGQLRLEVPVGERSAFRFGAAYYSYHNIVGLLNTVDSKLTDFTAPALLARGNTLFDIRNDLNPNTNLFALASDFRIEDLTAQLDFAAFGPNRLRLTLDYLENRAFDPIEVAARVGRTVDPRTKGHQIEISVGRDRVRERGEWRVFSAYRYLERDAVLDAFTDSDFGLGGTDTQGYIVGFDIGLTHNAWLTTKWLSSNEIDGPPLGIDVLQIDLNTRF